MDGYARLMLTVIAASLAAIAVNDWRDAGSAGEGAATKGRYVLTPIPMARMLLRFDSETGETSKAMFPDIKVWTPVANSLTEMLDQPGEPSPAPAPAPEPPPAEAPLDPDLSGEGAEAPATP